MVFLFHKLKYLRSLDELYVVMFICDYKYLNEQEKNNQNPTRQEVYRVDLQ